ncbi:DNA-binding response regulator, partial [Shewanella algae]
MTPLTPTAGATVHVIDDDATLRDALSFLLTSRGVAAELFASAEDFLLAYHNGMRGCVLTDVRMGA